MLQALYLENSVEVKIGDKRSDHFSVSTGRRALGSLLRGAQSAVSPWCNLSSFMEPKLGVP